MAGDSIHAAETRNVSVRKANDVDPKVQACLLIENKQKAYVIFPRPSRLAGAACAVMIGLGGAACAAGDADPSVADQLRLLQRQNQALQEQLRQQQRVIDELGKKVDKLQAAEAERPAGDAAGAEEGAGGSRANGLAPLSRLHLGGEGAVGFFNSQADGQFPHHEFRADDFRLYLEAPVWQEVYFYGELNIYQREETDAAFRAGEVYLDAENVSKLWGEESQLNVRAGRLNIPFGEEYLVRKPIDNPLISHSLTDLWGYDEGFELYGSFGPVSYVAAVQNGPVSATRDFNGDKAVAGRLAYDPLPWLHLSGSAMRTGAIDAAHDQVSALWIGPGFVRSIGSASTTSFQADLLEGDIQVRRGSTTVKAAGGMIHYEDDDRPARNRRQVTYYYAEAVQKIYGGLYAAARWSQIFAPGGYAVAGIGNSADYAFGSDLTTGLHLLSLGVGYRFSPQLVLKVEYSFEGGREADGTPRRREDMVGATAAFVF